MGTKPDVDIGEIARNIFETVLQNASFSQVGDSLVYGNSLGHNILAKREEFRLRLNALEMEVKEMKKTHSSEIAGLKARVRDLEAACEGYLQIRQRFLDTFRRDVLKDSTARWTDAIGLGNKAAHNGDAVTDATLYKTGVRKDRSLLVKIYGLDVHRILDLSRAGDNDSINILNAQATLKAHKTNPILEEIEDAWNEYVAHLEASWGETLENLESALGQVSCQFWDICGQRW